METFTLSRKELHRPGLLKGLCGGRLKTAQVAAALGITVRQVRRLRRRFEQAGPAEGQHDDVGAMFDEFVSAHARPPATRIQSAHASAAPAARCRTRPIASETASGRPRT